MGSAPIVYIEKDLLGISDLKTIDLEGAEEIFKFPFETYSGKLEMQLDLATHFHNRFIVALN